MQRVLIFELDPGLRSDLVRAVRTAGYAAEEAATREELIGWTQSTRFDAAIVDISTAADLEHIECLTSSASWIAVLATGANPSLELAVEAMKHGARDFLRKPFPVAALESSLRAVLKPLDCAAPGNEASALVAADPAMERLLSKTAKAAATEATVLIVGESGTGKDLLARFLHWHSPRRAGPLVAVNCAALPESLWESELFGHEQGAFTGAVDSRPGQLAAAAGGTLLLDEVSEVALALQPKLLRVLQEREVLPVGGLVPRPIDVRIVSTTQRDLASQVEAGRFREDLYYRLEVIVLQVPPLRERPADIRPLATAFLGRFAQASGSEPPRLGERGVARLLRHEFRGNVRELENLMRRAIVLYPGREVDVERLLAPRRTPAETRGTLDGSLNLREIERRAVLRSLAETGGNRTEASRALGISVRTLRNKIRLYGLR